MNEIIHVSRINQINLQRKKIQRQRFEAKLEKLREDNAQEASHYFLEEQKKQSTELKQHIEFTRYLEQENLKNQSASIKFDFKNIASNQFLSKYLAEFNISEILEFFGDEKIGEDNLDDLCDRLSESNGGEIRDMLENFFTSNKLTIAQIYMVAAYLRDELHRRKKAKNDLDEVLNGILRILERQNSAYLLDFFDLIKHPSIKGNHKLAETLAGLSSGTINVKNMRQGLDFINNNLDGSLDSIVSRCINCRSSILHKLAQSGASFEDKMRLAEYFHFEKILILINSVYHQLLDFKLELKAVLPDKNLFDANTATITSLLNLTEAAVVSESSLTNFLKQLDLPLQFKLNLGIINYIINLIRSLPIVVFNDSAAQCEKILYGLRTIIKQNSNKDKSIEKTFSFIRSVEPTIKLV